MKKYPFVTFSNEVYEDVVFSTFPENLHVDIAVIKELVSCRIDFTKNEKKFFIVDINNIRQVSAEAKYYVYNSREGLENVLGCALIANNLTSTLIANIFVKTPSIIPFKHFFNKESAISWIEELRTQNNLLKGNSL